MGTFLIGTMVGGTIRYKRLPVTEGECTVTRYGRGAITATIPTDIAYSLAGITWSDVNQNRLYRTIKWARNIHPDRDWLGYIEDSNNVGWSFLNAGPIKSVTVTADGIIVTAGGIANYLDDRFHDRGTMIYNPGDPDFIYSLGTTVQQETDVKNASDWMAEAITTLNMRSTFTYPGIGGTINKLVPITYNASLDSIGPQDGGGPSTITFKYPNKGSDFLTFRDRLDGMIDNGADWASRPVIPSQASNILYDLEASTSIAWELYIGNHYPTRLGDQIEVYWDNSSPRSESPVKDFRLMIDNETHANVIHSDQPDGVRASHHPVDAAELVNTEATDLPVPLKEKRQIRDAIAPVSRSLQLDGLTASISFKTPRRNGPIPCSNALPGRWVHLTMPDNPAFGGEDLLFRVMSFTVRENDPDMLIEGVWPIRTGSQNEWQ